MPITLRRRGLGLSEPENPGGIPPMYGPYDRKSDPNGSRWRDEAHDEMRPRWDDAEKDWKRDYSDEDGVVEVERDYKRLKRKYMSQGVSEEEFDAWWRENFDGPDGSDTYQARDPEFFRPKKYRTGGRF